MSCLNKRSHWLDHDTSTEKMGLMMHNVCCSNKHHLIWRTPKSLMNLKRALQENFYKVVIVIDNQKWFRNAVFHTKICPGTDCKRDQLPVIFKLRVKFQSSE